MNQLLLNGISKENQPVKVLMRILNVYCILFLLVIPKQNVVISRKFLLNLKMELTCIFYYYTNYKSLLKVNNAIMAQHSELNSV